MPPTKAQTEGEATEQASTDDAGLHDVVDALNQQNTELKAQNDALLAKQAETDKQIAKIMEKLSAPASTTDSPETAELKIQNAALIEANDLLQAKQEVMDTTLTDIMAKLNAPVPVAQAGITAVTTGSDGQQRVIHQATPENMGFELPPGWDPKYMEPDTGNGRGPGHWVDVRNGNAIKVPPNWTPAWHLANAEVDAALAGSR